MFTELEYDLLRDGLDSLSRDVYKTTSNIPDRIKKLQLILDLQRKLEAIQEDTQQSFIRSI